VIKGNGPDFQSILGGSNGATVKLSNSVLNPDLQEQYSLNYQLFLERELAPGLSARLGYTCIQSRNTWPRFGFYNNIDTPRIARLGVIYEFSRRCASGGDEQPEGARHHDNERQPAKERDRA
jgi:hypothetical protein